MRFFVYSSNQANNKEQIVVPQPRDNLRRTRHLPRRLLVLLVDRQRFDVLTRHFRFASGFNYRHLPASSTNVKTNLVAYGFVSSDVRDHWVVWGGSSSQILTPHTHRYLYRSYCSCAGALLVLLCQVSTL